MNKLKKWKYLIIINYQYYQNHSQFFNATAQPNPNPNHSHNNHANNKWV